MKERVVCLNCIDGRVQLPVIKWIQNNYNVDYVDMITEPGIDGLVSDDSCSIEDIIRKIKISIDKNGVAMLFFAGHYDCRGNPISDSEHKEQVLLSVERLKKEFSEIDIIGLWINSLWECEKIV